MSDSDDRVGAIARVLASARQRGSSRSDLERALLEMIRATASAHGADALGPRAIAMLEDVEVANANVESSLWCRLTDALREVIHRRTCADRCRLSRWSGDVTFLAAPKGGASPGSRSALGLLIEETAAKGRSR